MFFSETTAKLCFHTHSTQHAIG